MFILLSLRAMEKIINHPIIGEVRLRKGRGNKSIRLSVHPRRGVMVSVPWYVSYSRATRFLEEKIEWVKHCIEKQKITNDILENSGKIIKSPNNTQGIEELRKKAKIELIPRMEVLAAQYGFEYNKICIRNNSSNWGSCSGKNNINLNMRLVMVPKHLQDYVILHELCHLRHHNHGKDFHILLDTLCGGQEKALSKELREWRLL